MKVSAEFFAAIIDSLRSDQRRTNEKRNKPRVGLSGKALLQQDDGSFISVSVRDLSQTGVGLIRNNSWPVGKRFTLCFSSAAHADEYKGIICEVARSQRVADCLFAIGAKFIEHITVSTKPDAPRKPRTIEEMMAAQSWLNPFRGAGRRQRQALSASTSLLTGSPCPNRRSRIILRSVRRLQSPLLALSRFEGDSLCNDV
jgi:hypothetical protein